MEVTFAINGYAEDNKVSCEYKKNLLLILHIYGLGIEGQAAENALKILLEYYIIRNFFYHFTTYLYHTTFAMENLNYKDVTWALKPLVMIRQSSGHMHATDVTSTQVVKCDIVGAPSISLG